MPEETAVLNAPADLGGSSAPASTETPSTPASPSTPAASQPQQTDEEILGIEPVGSTPEKPVEPAAKEPEKPADPNAPKTDDQKAAEQLAEDGRLMPVKWRELAKSDPEFRTLFYQNRVNAEKLAAIEPQFTEFQTKIAAVEKADTAYLSGDPVAIQGELKNFVADKPDALVPMYQAGEQLLKEMQPQEYSRIQSERVSEGLRSQNFESAFQVLRQAVESGNTEILQAQVEKILDWAGKNGFPTTDAERLSSRAAQLDAREQAHQQADERSYMSTQESFRTTVNKELETSIKGQINTSLDKLLEKAAFGKGARERIESDVYSEINKMLSQNVEIPTTLNKMLFPNGVKDAAGKQVRAVLNDANRKAAIDLPINYAKSVLNDVVKKIVETYTNDFMATNQNRDAKAAAAGARTDVSGGNLQDRAPRPLSKKDVDYSRMSDDDILGA